MLEAFTGLAEEESVKARLEALALRSHDTVANILKGWAYGIRVMLSHIRMKAKNLSQMKENTIGDLKAHPGELTFL